MKRKQEESDYQPIDLQPDDDYQPSDNSTSKRAADNDYDDNNPEKVGEDQSILLTSNCDDPEVAPNIYTGGLVSNKAFMYNGLAWEELPPMSVRRDTPMCSLIQKEDKVQGVQDQKFSREIVITKKPCTFLTPNWQSQNAFEKRTIF